MLNRIVGKLRDYLFELGKGSLVTENVFLGWKATILNLCWLTIVLMLNFNKQKTEGLFTVRAYEYLLMFNEEDATSSNMVTCFRQIGHL